MKFKFNICVSIAIMQYNVQHLHEHLTSPSSMFIKCLHNFKVAYT